MANGPRASSFSAGARSNRAARSTTACACALALLVAACAHSPSRADGEVHATSAARTAVSPGAAQAAPSGAANAAAAAADTGATGLGEQTYSETCVACHGADGNGGQGGGMPLTAVPTVDFVIETVSYGRNNMPAFTGVLTSEQIRAVSDYVLTLVKH
jgi:mono/diheme cytochrome c family protein